MLTSSSGTSILTDPYTGVGYELPIGLQADVVTTSHAHFDHNYTQNIRCEKILSKIGDTLYKDVRIVGVESYHDEKQGALRGKNIVFKYFIDGLVVCHLGDLGEDVTDGILSKIGSVDVLLLPVGGTYTIDAKQAKAYVEGIAPKIVIPMHFKPSDGKLDIDGVDVFLSQFSHDCITDYKTNEVEINAIDLQGGALSIIYLERSI